jgi:FMN phosphatase YigB (HAD superfamily)/DNA-binding XRE family transcriptional regulator
MDEKGLVKRLQQMRQAANYTQQELCDRANLSYSTLAKIERGAIKTPSIFTIQSIAGALGVGLDQLLGIEPSFAHHDASSKQVSKSGVRFVYFDLNGCLVRFIHQGFTKLAQDSGQPLDVVESVYMHYDSAVCRGDVSLDELNTIWAERLGVMVDWKKYYLEAASAMPGISELVEWVAKQYYIGILSNTMPGFIHALREQGKVPDVEYDAIIDSSIVHALKPEPAIFETAATQAGVAADQILLIDDTRANLMAAEELGWRTIWFDQFDPEGTIEGIRQALES